MTPFFFEGCFGWFHPGGKARGVVLCGPIGSESDYVQRAWRDLAEQLSAAGLSVLRFDYPGVRNSLERDPATPPVRAWIDSVKAARRWLREEAGCEDVVLVGLRLGATLAAAAAEELGDVDRLVLLAPVASGNAYLRELTILQRMDAAARHVMADPAMEVHGLEMTPQVSADLKALKFCAGGVRPARRVLVLPRPGMTRDAKLSETLRRCGAEVQELPFEGYAALMVNPEVAAYPAEAFAGLTAWLTEGQTATTAEAARPAKASRQLTRAQAREAGVLYREGQPLCGVLSSPKRARKDLPAILFLNTGAISHAGMGGMWVSMARRFAALGFTSLRFDIAGFGDSPARPGQRDPFIHMDEAFGDVEAAIEWLQAKGYSRVTLIGFCWGAQLACNMALRDTRVTGLVLINARRQFWELDTPADSIVGLGSLLRMARQRSRWRNLLRGHAPWATIASLPGRLLRRVIETRAARWLGRETAPEAAARKLRSLRARGVETLMVQGLDDPFLVGFEDYFATPRHRLGQLFGMTTHFAPGVDHLFRNTTSLDLAGETIAAHLRRTSAPSTLKARPARAVAENPTRSSGAGKHLGEAT